jgi:acetyl coenzyme A synthetase (ADP forming)-like protein
MQSATLRAYAEPVILRDGTSLTLRALRSSDKALLAAFFSRLSPESIHYRVFGQQGPLTEKQLAYLTELDFEEHVALAAVVIAQDGAERIVGIGRYVRVAGHRGMAAPSRRAEAAFTVEDAYQGRGIGTLLLEHLVEVAKACGVEQVEAFVLADNARMMEVFAESGFAVKRSLEANVFHVTFPTDATQAFLRASLARERGAAAQSMRAVFEPASVAVVGASRHEGSIGRAILDNLVKCGFNGPIHVVNAHAGEVSGRPAVPTVSAIGAPVDLVIIAVPAASVEEVVKDCARAHARGVVVISAGFGETSGDGGKVEARLAEIARGAGMRLIGPNCMGVLNRDPAISMNATFAPSWPPAGGVSMLSQSGALGLAMLDHAVELHMGIADFVSVGNKADVSANDLLAYWADDPKTQVVALYLESFGNPRKFARIAPEVARKKPIVAVKSGRSAAGTRAAASHSAALASVDVGVDALFAQAGVIRTNTIEELFDVVSLLSTQPLPLGSRVGVVTNAGGPGILLADACEAHGLSLPELSRETQSALRGFLPPTASVKNPVDMIASATPDQFAAAIELVGADPNVDSLVVIYIPPLVTKPEEVAAAVARAAGTVPASKPIATVFMGSRGTPPTLAGGRRGNIPSYSFPENVALALSAAVRCAEWRKRPTGKVLVLERDVVRAVRRVVDRLMASGAASPWAPAGAVAEILALVGIRVAPSEQIGPDVELAANAADRLGYPVVLKAVATGLLHKSDVGGVTLGLRDATAVRAAASVMSARIATAGHALEGFLVQSEIDDGLEALVGVSLDPSLGPLLVAGLGGVQVELLRDVSFRITPVSDVDAAEMADSLRSAKLFDGFRGSPPVDRRAFLDVIQRVSALVEAFPELVELEMNPLKVLPRGRGAIVVDARMRLAPASNIAVNPA